MLEVVLDRWPAQRCVGFFKYACELTPGVPVVSLAPSIASIYEVDLKLAKAATIGISQSGKSPDIVAMLESARRSGAATLAFTNNPASPLAQASDHVVDICAGPELSVAATKTFVTSLVSGLSLVAQWSEDADLLAAIEALPEDLARAPGHDWSELLECLSMAQSLYVLVRGPGMAIASEAALKFKETSGLHGEAYSTAEVLHGPSAIAAGALPVLVMGAQDASRRSILRTAHRLADQGTNLFVADADADLDRCLPVARTSLPLTFPISRSSPFTVSSKHSLAAVASTRTTPRTSTRLPQRDECYSDCRA